MERKNAWEKYPEGKKREEVFQFAEDYRKFISECKTERECTTEFAKRAEKAGFVNLDEVLEKGTKLKAGDRVYANNMGKGIAMFVIGKKGLEAGMNILGAHIDSPRMDLKQDPLYEDTDFAMLDTHYYGGIKKYQWVTLPLALHGVIAKKDGTVVKVNVGDKPGDPVFGVSDLLIHLSGEQLEKKAAKVIEGENLDLIIGSIPAEEAGDDKEAAKELDFLQRVKKHLEDGNMAITMELENEDEEAWMGTYNLLTWKPVIYAANVSEDDLADDGESNAHVQAVRKYAAEQKSEVFVICAEIEEEISELDDDEKKMFLEDLGLKESGLEKLVRASYRLLGLMSFLTSGEDETRAWTIKIGTKAPQAAGKIHTDFERGFIKAEVVNYQDLLDCGSYAGAREKGLVRMEGKEYIVQDGDVILFRFNV